MFLAVNSLILWNSQLRSQVYEVFSYLLASTIMGYYYWVHTSSDIEIDLGGCVVIWTKFLVEIVYFQSFDVEEVTTTPTASEKTALSYVETPWGNSSQLKWVVLGLLKNTLIFTFALLSSMVPTIWFGHFVLHWSLLLVLCLASRYYITGTSKEQLTNGPELKAWHSQKVLVITWLFNSMEQPSLLLVICWSCLLVIWHNI